MNTCRADQGPEAGSWFCSTRFSFGNPTWRQSCCSRGSLDMTPSLPTEDGRVLALTHPSFPASLHVGVTFSTHHDVGGDDTGVVTHGFNKKDLRTDKQHCSNLLLCRWGENSTP